MIDGDQILKCKLEKTEIYRYNDDVVVMSYVGTFVTSNTDESWCHPLLHHPLLSRTSKLLRRHILLTIWSESLIVTTQVGTFWWSQWRHALRCFMRSSSAISYIGTVVRSLGGHNEIIHWWRFVTSSIGYFRRRKCAVILRHKM